jgi:cell division septation protein DedD
MREMHKWKDKVEFSLDNRQIFFLFFGLSVVGCFVFALGVMTGRRLEWEPEGQVAALGQDSLDLLDPAGDGPDGLMGLTFKQGLEESAAADLPATRDPELAPRDEDEVKAEKKAKKEADAEAAKVAAKAEKAAKKAEPALPKKAAQGATLASGADEAAANKPAQKVFTLQMKAFSRADEAEQFADKLRRNGHDVRVEQAQVRGRTWHRVRMGRFTDWNEALGAKAEFEKAEHVIAYVVSE